MVTRIGADDRGSLSVPLALLFLTLAIAAFGILGVLRNWRGKVAIQLEIDRCVGIAAQNLRDTLHSLGELNKAMVATRASLATIGQVPELRAPLQAALEGEVVAQDVLLGKWIVTMGVWLAKSGCRGASGDVPKPLPGLELSRPPPDSLGSKPLERDSEASSDYVIWLSHPPRYAAAKVTPNDDPSDGDGNDDTDEAQETIADSAAGLSDLPTDWQAQWANPFSIPGWKLTP